MGHEIRYDVREETEDLSKADWLDGKQCLPAAAGDQLLALYLQ
ncbi:MAG: hypothetical protein ACKV2U_27080 [Bryobacteraceae bacterium]